MTDAGKLPETTLVVGLGTGISQVEACAVNEVWQTAFRGLASYTIPKADVSAVIRSVANAQPQTNQDSVASNGLSLNANYDVSTAQVLAAIGRPLPGGAQTQSVNLVNIFNSNTGTAFDQAFGTNGSTYLRPTAILNPRFVRFNATVDF